MVTTRTTRALALAALAGLAVLVAALTVSPLIAGPSAALVAVRVPPTLSSGVTGLAGAKRVVVPTHPADLQIAQVRH